MRRVGVALLAGLGVVAAATPEGQASGCKDGGTFMVTLTPAGHEHACLKQRPDGTSVLHGYYVLWSRSGVKALEGHHLEGQRHGRWRTRDADGRVVAEQDFDRGTPVPPGAVKQPFWHGYGVAHAEPPPCPPATELAGSISDLGHEQWCERPAPDSIAVEHGRYLAWSAQGGSASRASTATAASTAGGPRGAGSGRAPSATMSTARRTAAGCSTRATTAGCSSRRSTGME